MALSFCLPFLKLSISEESGVWFADLTSVPFPLCEVAILSQAFASYIHILAEQNQTLLT